MKEIEAYNLWLFDCDGVILDSNSIKTDAYLAVAAPYGAAEELLNYHRQHVGVSRYAKLRHLFANILGMTDFESDYHRAVARYGDLVRERLLSCSEVPGVREFLRALRQRGERPRMYVVSGSDELELREVLSFRGLSGEFDGVYGSPKPKSVLVAEIRRRIGNELDPVTGILCGDSRLDWEVATEHSLDFVMFEGYSQWTTWSAEVSPGTLAVRDFNHLTELCRGRSAPPLSS